MAANYDAIIILVSATSVIGYYGISYHCAHQLLVCTSYIIIHTLQIYSTYLYKQLIIVSAISALVISY